MTDRIERLTEVFQDVFENDDLQIGRETTSRDVEGWDSLMHVTLLINVEKAFGVRFSSSEIAGLKDVGELLDLLEAKSA
jgi:acyl carrier protein